MHQDGSCNGLQHYAALGRDESGGRAVNLLPVDKPQVMLLLMAGLFYNQSWRSFCWQSEEQSAAVGSSTQF